MQIVAILLVFFAISGGHAQEEPAPKKKEKIYDNDLDIQLDEQYEAGPFLIYQCGNKHFACVNKKSRDKCQLQRYYAQQTGDRNLQCANLKEFKVTKHCVHEQMKMIARPKEMILCKRGPIVSKPEIVSPSLSAKQSE